MMLRICPPGKGIKTSVYRFDRKATSVNQKFVSAVQAQSITVLRPYTILGFDYVTVPRPSSC